MTKQERQIKERQKADKRNALDGFVLKYELIEAEKNFNKKVGK